MIKVNLDQQIPDEIFSAIGGPGAPEDLRRAIGNLALDSMLLRNILTGGIEQAPIPEGCDRPTYEQVRGNMIVALLSDEP